MRVTYQKRIDDGMPLPPGLPAAGWRVPKASA